MKGYVNISRSNDETIKITVQDEADGATVCMIQMSPEAFGNAITGLTQECEVFDGMNILGKKIETKEEWIDISGVNNLYLAKDFEDQVSKLAERFESDGWMIDRRTIRSCDYHNVSGSFYKLTFYRYVESN